MEFTERQGVAIEHLTDNHTRFVLFGGAAGGGKSWVIVSWLIGMAMSKAGTRWFIGREELKRLRESTLVTFYKLCSFYKIPRNEFTYNGQDHYIKFSNGSQIDLLDLKFLPSDPLYERYGSIEYTGGAIDEGGEINFGAFDVLKTRIGRFNNEKRGLLPAKMLITANPKKNWLYKIFYQPYKSGTLPSDYAFIPALASENPYLDKGYLENLDKITDNVTRERLKYGNWEYDDTKDQLISYDKILDLFTNSHVETGPGFITADIARFGKDNTQVGRWNGWRLVEMIRLPKSSIPLCISTIKTLATKHGIPMSRTIVDEDGVGGGVKDGLDCKGFTANAKPVQIQGRKENYQNLKSQCGFLFSERANRSGVYLQDVSENEKTLIIEEVEQLRSASMDSDLKLSLISKDKIKEIIGRSPDYMDMLIMREFFELPHVGKITHWKIS